MNNQDLNTELFDRYLHHELSDAELAEFNENLLNDDRFNADFIAYKTIALGIRDYGKADLKNYLKTNVKINASGNTFPFRKMVYAMAASLILIAGLSLVINFYSSTNKAAAVIASSETVHQEVPIEDTISHLFKEEDLADVSPKMAEDESLAPPPLEPSIEMADKKAEDLAVQDDYTVAGAAAIEKDTKSFKVLSDFKISDTILFAVNFAEQEDTKLNKASSQKVKEYKKAIPSANNNTYGKNETNNDLDTSVQFRKKALLNKTASYTLEFWQSPINFKGYKMVDKTIQLFGLPNKNIKLFNYNNQLYLRSFNSVYALTPCVDGCTYKTEPDEQIVNQILNQ